MDIPGCEPGHTKAGAQMDLLRPRIRQNARATASAAYFYGKEGALCECFHSLGWSGTLQDAKLISEGLLLMGIRYLVPHGFFYTTHALAKHDAPPTFFFQMPYWPLFGALSERIERIAAHFEGTYIDADVLVVDPSSGLPSRSDLEDYERLLNLLVEQHVDFLIVDTDILESGCIEDGRVRIRDIVAHTVLLPPMQFVEAPLASWLEAFERAGGSVVCLNASLGPAPVVERLPETARSLRVSAIEGDAGRLQVVARTDGQRHMWFLLNTGGEALQVTLSGEAELREIPLDDGIPCTLTGRNGAYTRTVHPFESFLIEAAEPASAQPPTPRLILPVGRPTKVAPVNANLLRMVPWEMELLDERGQPTQRATVPAIPLPNQLAYGRLRYAPQVNTFFGAQPELQLSTIHANYRFSFENRFRGAIELVMEPGSLVGEWQIRVNHSDPITAGDFGHTDAHVRGSLAVDISPYVAQGTNEITISLRTDRVDGGLVNPLYLAGDFGVTLDPVRLVAFEPAGGYETWEENGLPYYAGVVEYETSFHLEALPEGEQILIELDHGVPFQDAVEIALNGGPWYAMPWSPYCALLPRSQLCEGDNALAIRVHTTLIRAFEGQWFDITDHCYREVGETT
jgi:hypothetical protein